MTAQTITLAADGIDPKRVPTRTLADGTRIPVVGLGTSGSDKYSGEVVAAAVIEAATLGYRHFDCAAEYGNEEQIGKALRLIQDGGIRREELWITSKVWNDMHGDGDVIRACKQSLKDLQLDALDLYLVHWPFPNFRPKGGSVDDRNPDARPYIHKEYMRVWEQMEELVRMGLVRAIGTSNMTAAKMKWVLRDCAIKPAVNEMELHPHFQQPGLYGYMVENGIQPIGFCPVGSPSRPPRDRTSTDTTDTEDPVVLKIADRLGVHPAVVCIMWALKRGHVAIPFSVRREQLLGNLRAAVDNPLTPDDMRAIGDIDRNGRLIRGQAFLWRKGLTWRALWDEDGVIKR